MRTWLTGDYPYRSVLAFGSALLVALIGVAASNVAARSQAPPTADGLLIVDCLLPGQLRKLGRQVTYLTARRPIKTSAHDCELRGGEYVAEDRASYGAALKMWLPLAQEGDVTAQAYVGEIYEKGLGLQPEYVAAAQWYGKAAEQGDPRAQINLGHLYEKGLGVRKDPVTAMNWYRKAAGLAGPLIIDSGTLNANAAEIQELRGQIEDQKAESQRLRQQLEETRRQLDDARRELRQREQDARMERRDLERARAELKRQRDAARAQKDTAKVAELDRELAEQQADLARKDKEITRLRNEINRVQSEAERHRQQLASLGERGAEFDSLRQEVARGREESARMSNELAETRTQLDQAKAEAAERAAEVASARQEFLRAQKEMGGQKGKDAVPRDGVAVARLETALKRREGDLARQHQELARLNKEVRRVESEAKRYKEKLAQARQPAAAAPQEQKASSLPTIEIIDPPLVATRGIPSVTLRGGLIERLIVGKVVAPAGLNSLTVNDKPKEPNEKGVFRLSVPLQVERTPVTVVAVDQNGARASVRFEFLQGEIQKQTTVANAELAGIEFGTYYALIIGNNEYAHLPKLNTAVNDVNQVEQILRTQYGFKTKKAINANRYQLLSALNEMRQRLTEKDNLLIYYAGHGELDRVNLRGHWLPVDAEPDNTANWISNVSITDILNTMSARQILVVADSCYSGALTRSSLGRLEAGVSDEAKANWVKVMAKKRSRTVLTAGGLNPVLDSTGGDHSVFAKAFIEVLRENKGLLEGRRLFQDVADLVAQAASNVDFSQVPEYAPIKHAGHEGGDFFFLPIS